MNDNDLVDIFGNLSEVYFLFLTFYQAYKYCCHNNLDCSHLIEIGNITDKRLNDVILRLDLYLQNT